MPTKRTRRTRNATTVQLTDAQTFFLMVGPAALGVTRIEGLDGAVRFRLPGWLGALQLAASYQARPAELDRDVAAYLPDLIAEAKRHRFAPWIWTKRTPTGQGFENWRDKFLSEHLY